MDSSFNLFELGGKMFFIIFVVVGIMFVLFIGIFIFMVTPYGRKHLIKRNAKIGIEAKKEIYEENGNDIRAINNMEANYSKDKVKVTARAFKEGFSEGLMFCKHCGAEIDKDSKYCKSCGKEQ